MCDVVLTHARHILLGQPWQFDRHIIHDSYTNRYFFIFNEKFITLVPLSPRSVWWSNDVEKRERVKRRVRVQNQEGLN